MDMLAEQILNQMQRQQVRFLLIGASAGAIDALSHLVPALPATTALAVMSVVHIPQDRNSLLTSIFQPKCALEVIEPCDKQLIEPAHWYFAPPGYHMLVECQGVLSLSTDPAVNYSRPSIDVLFESAADAFGSAAMGVVLTGANRDGAQGLRAICDRGGMALVQEPGDAESSIMPQSALDLCPEAYTLSIKQLEELFQQF